MQMIQNRAMHFVLFFVVLMYSVVLNMANPCTNTVGVMCTCTYTGKGELTVNCSKRSLIEIPDRIQKDVVSLILKDNSITSIELDIFSGMNDLQSLLLENNLIATIAPGAFDRLYKLQSLTLHNNKLTRVLAGHFHHLPSLVLLDLSYNKIATIERESILYLPKLGQLAINANPLKCDCEMRAFRQSINARGGNLLVISAQCEGTNEKMTTVAESTFGSCSGENLFKDLNCMDCKNVRSANQCIASNQTRSCLKREFNQQPVCVEEIVYVTSGIIINKGCQTYASCLQSERTNGDQCHGQETSARCYFCCIGEFCNRTPLRGRTHSASYLVTFLINGAIPSSFPSNFATYTQTQVENILNNKPNSYGSYVAKVTYLGPPGFTAKMRLEFNTIVEQRTAGRENFITNNIGTLLNLYTAAYPIISFNVSLINAIPCPATTTSDDKGRFSWSSVFPGEVSVVLCPSQPSVTASRACISNAAGNPVWDPPDTSTCTYSSTTTQSLSNLADIQVNSNNADSVQSQLLELSKESSSYNDVDVKLSVDVIEDILKEGSVYSNTQKAQNMVETMSNILNTPDNVVTQSENSYQSSQRFVKAVDDMSNKILPSSGDFSAVTDNLALLVKQTNPNNFGGVTMNVNSVPGNKLSANEFSVQDGEDPSSLNSGVVLPSTMFDTVSKNSPRLSFAVYGNNKMFVSVSKSSLSSNPLVLPKDVKEVGSVNGPVISAAVQDADVQGLGRPVLFRFKHTNANAKRPQCVYLNPSASSGMEWSDAGCVMKEHVEGSHTDCECNHLTNFALLMDIYQTGGGLSSANRLALTYISYIGCGVSLLGLLFTLFTYFMFRKLRVNNPSKILINLCLALAVTNVIFLVGMQEYTLDNEIGCKIVAVLLHYVLLAAISWMLVEAFYMYLALIKVFNTYVSHFLLKCCLFGWGVPLVIVAVTLGINKTENYGQQAGGICWLSPTPFYAAFLAPVGIILILNFITFVLVFKTLMKGSSKKLTKSDNKNSIAQRLRGAIALVVLLGLTWAFAIFAIGDGGIVFQYLFTIFNSLQGLFISIFYCFLKTDARLAWKKKVCGDRTEYSGPTTTKEKTFDRSKDINTYTSEVSKKDFTDISKEIADNYPETRTKSKPNNKRYPSYSESNT